MAYGPDCGICGLNGPRAFMRTDCPGVVGCKKQNLMFANQEGDSRKTVTPSGVWSKEANAVARRIDTVAPMSVEQIAPVVWIVEEALTNATKDLDAALRELVCWLRKGTTAEQAGAKCETLGEAIEQAEAAIKRAE